MVLFDLLKVSDDGKRLYIDFHVNRAEYFKDIYLDSITIMTADKVSETDPVTPTAEYIYKKVYDDGQKEDALVLGPMNMNENFKPCDFSHDLLFVYVKVKGTPDPCTPCTLDEEWTLGVTFDENLLHQKVLGYTSEMLKDCNVPQGFTDFILLWQAFKSSVESEHYIMAYRFWQMLFDKTVGTLGSTKGCGCNGKNHL